MQGAKDLFFQDYSFPGTQSNEEFYGEFFSEKAPTLCTYLGLGIEGYVASDEAKSLKLY